MEIKKVCVVGAGTMGSGIAQAQWPSRVSRSPWLTLSRRSLIGA
jgi:hypothetical protein